MSQRHVRAFLAAALFAAVEANAAEAPFVVLQRTATTQGYEVLLASPDDEATLSVVYHQGDNFIVSTDEITATDSDDAKAITATDSDDAKAFRLYAESWVTNGVRYFIVRHDGAMVAYVQISGGQVQWNHQDTDALAGVEMLVAAAVIELDYAVGDDAAEAIKLALLDWIKG
jgi:hypothetical protein